MPSGVGHRRVARRDSIVRRGHPLPIKVCGTPVATAPPRTVSRMQSCVATDSEGLLRPCVGEGAQHDVEKRLVCESDVCGRSWSVRLLSEDRGAEGKGSTE